MFWEEDIGNEVYAANARESGSTLVGLRENEAVFCVHLFL